MLLQMGQYEYDSIIYALNYAIKDIDIKKGEFL